jgi:aminoglycoside phosphotransferase (APT) family kinase protein
MPANAGRRQDNRRRRAPDGRAMTGRSTEAWGDRPLLARGTSADLLGDGPGRALKLYHAATGAAAVQTEQSALARAAGAGLPVPSVFGRGDIGPRPGLLIEWRHEPTVLRQMLRRPPIAPRTLDEMATLHRRVNALDGRGLPDQKDAVRAVLRQAPLGAGLQRAVTAQLDALPTGTALCHGDIHLGNVLVADAGLCILDWEKACCGAPAGDLARTLVLIRHGTFDGPLPRPLVGALRRWLARRYRRAYTAAGRRLDPAELDGWITVMTAAKLAFVPDPQAARLRADLRRRLGV